MNDTLISKQELINDLNKLLKMAQDDREIQCLQKAIECVKAAKSAWTPCDKCLPDNDESVLITHSHGVTKAWWNGRFWANGMTKKFKTVKAWMPLPAPYEE